MAPIVTSIGARPALVVSTHDHVDVPIPSVMAADPEMLDARRRRRGVGRRRGRKRRRRFDYFAFRGHTGPSFDVTTTERDDRQQYTRK